jgi:hypothetical protein
MTFDLRRIVLLALLAALAAAGCHPSLVGLKQDPVNQPPPPVSQLGPPDEIFASQWEAGRTIYVDKCASCHKPKPIQDFFIEDWNDKIIPRMSLKAKLTSKETQSLTEYVMAVKRLQLLGKEHDKAKSGITPISAVDNR